MFGNVGCFCLCVQLVLFDQVQCEWVVVGFVVVGFYSGDDVEYQVQDVDDWCQDVVDDYDGQYDVDQYCDGDGDLEVQCFFGLVCYEGFVGVIFVDQLDDQWVDELGEDVQQVCGQCYGVLVGWGIGGCWWWWDVIEFIYDKIFFYWVVLIYQY